MGDIGGSYPALRHDCRTDGHINGWGLNTVDFHFGYILYFQQLVLYQFGLVFQFTERIAVTGKPVEHAQYISKVIVYNGRAGSGG